MEGDLVGERGETEKTNVREHFHLGPARPLAKAQSNQLPGPAVESKGVVVSIPKVSCNWDGMERWACS